MLTKMLEESDTLNKYTPPDKAILMKLAHTFQTTMDNLFYNPEELQEYTQLSTKEKWAELLNLQETKNYIKSMMAALAEISQRKTFKSLVEMAMKGSAPAAKQVQELSGVLNSVDSNRVVVLHQIPRPKENE